MNRTTERSTLQSIFSRVVAGGVLLIGSCSVNAALVNSDFSQGADGFDAWQAEVIHYDTSTTVETISTGAISSFQSGLFSHDGAGEVMLAPGSDNDGDFYQLTMFQDFTLDPLAAGETLWLSLSVLASLTDPVEDYFAIQIRDLGTNAILDLSAGGTFDITSWVGGNLTFEMIIADSDFLLDDLLTVSGINFSVTASQVSEPSVILLFMAALMLAFRRRMNS